MKTTISKRFDFDAAHRLPNVPEGHKCGRMHGHTYVVELVLSGVVEPDGPDGWFIDYAEIAKAWTPMHDKLDHRVLNEIKGLENPTTEMLCQWVWSRLITDKRIGCFLEKVRIYESSTTWCEVSG